MKSPFDSHVERYDGWFDRHREQYEAELAALRAVIPPFRYAVEIGVGTGRFAAPLGIPRGVEPSSAMAALARQRGVEVMEGYAESLPLPDSAFDLALFMTTICFVRDPALALCEARRILCPDGHIVIGFVDKNSPLGKQYEAKRNGSPFYKDARFFAEDELFDLLRAAGFGNITAKRICLPMENELPDPTPSDIQSNKAGDFTVLCAAVVETIPAP